MFNVLFTWVIYSGLTRNEKKKEDLPGPEIENRRLVFSMSVNKMCAPRKLGDFPFHG